MVVDLLTEGVFRTNEDVFEEARLRGGEIGEPATHLEGAGGG